MFRRIKFILYDLIKSIVNTLSNIYKENQGRNRLANLKGRLPYTYSV